MARHTRPGAVVRLRLSPQSVQALLYVVEAFGNKAHRIESLSEACSQGIAGVVKYLIVQGVIPEPNPFEYDQSVNRYLWQGKGVKIQASMRNTDVALAAAIADVDDPQVPAIIPRSEYAGVAEEIENKFMRGRASDTKAAELMGELTSTIPKDSKSLFTGTVSAEEIKRRATARRVDYLRRAVADGSASLVEREELDKYSSAHHAES